MSKRLPRFKRASTICSLKVTDRDKRILNLVHEKRFLRSGHLTAFIRGSAQAISRRLQLLYHNGYLERPRAQLTYYHKGGSRQIVYGLGNKGAKLLNSLGVAVQGSRWNEKNAAVGRMFLEHALLISDVMVALTLACRKCAQLRLITAEELRSRESYQSKRETFRWRVTLKGGRKLGVVPDGVFAVEITGNSGTPERRFFILEADRGTMPVIRKNLSQTSMYRKFLAYEATWSQSVLKRRFGINRFRVITITKSTGRVESLVNACLQLEGGKGLFLFAHRNVLGNPDLLLAPVWIPGSGTEPEGLLS